MRSAEYVRAGHNEKNPAAAVWVTVALTTTAPMPVAGRPKRPATGTSAVRLCPGSAPSGASRLSSKRAGATGTNSPTSLDAVLGPVNQPTRSTMSCPPDWENIADASTAEAGEHLVGDRPAGTHDVDVAGRRQRWCRWGRRVQNPLAALSVTVTFKAAAVASAGRPASRADVDVDLSAGGERAEVDRCWVDGCRADGSGVTGVNRPACGGRGRRVVALHVGDEIGRPSARTRRRCRRCRSARSRGWRSSGRPSRR